MDRLLLLESLIHELGCHKHEEIQNKAQRMFYRGHQVALKFARKRDGYTRSGNKYTEDEKFNLCAHVTDFLIRGEFPDFDYISDHMLRSPTGLEQQIQKLFTDSNWTWENLVELYDITPEEAKRLIAPQHHLKTLL